MGDNEQHDEEKMKRGNEATNKHRQEKRQLLQDIRQQEEENETLRRQVENLEGQQRLLQKLEGMIREQDNE